MSQAIIATGQTGIHRKFEIADEFGRTVRIVPFHQAVA
jgi:hypothetical protein